MSILPRTLSRGKLTNLPQTFGTTKSDSFNPIVFGGTDVTVTAEAGAVIDGNGQAYWDGQGSNGGVAK
jgi:polygalacturonase